MPKNLPVELLKDDFDDVCGVKSGVVLKEDNLTFDITSFLLGR